MTVASSLCKQAFRLAFAQHKVHANLLRPSALSSLTCKTSWVFRQLWPAQHGLNSSRRSGQRLHTVVTAASGTCFHFILASPNDRHEWKCAVHLDEQCAQQMLSQLQHSVVTGTRSVSFYLFYQFIVNCTVMRGQKASFPAKQQPHNKGCDHCVMVAHALCKCNCKRKRKSKCNCNCLITGSSTSVKVKQQQIAAKSCHRLCCVCYTCTL